MDHPILPHLERHRVIRGASDVVRRRAVEYRAALYDFAEGRISWLELVLRLQALRRVVRRRRGPA